MLKKGVNPFGLFQSAVQAETLFCRNKKLLPNRTGNLGKYVVGVSANQADGANHDHQNDSQHHGIFSNVLAFVVRPQYAKKISHLSPPSKVLSQPVPGPLSPARLRSYPKPAQHRIL